MDLMTIVIEHSRIKPNRYLNYFKLRSKIDIIISITVKIRFKINFSDCKCSVFSLAIWQTTYMVFHAFACVCTNCAKIYSVLSYLED